MKGYNFPLDHFGLVSGHLIASLTRLTGDKRSRKKAKNDLVLIAKASKQIPRDAKISLIGLLVDEAGQIHLSFLNSNEPGEEERALVESIASREADERLNQLERDSIKEPL